MTFKPCLTCGEPSEQIRCTEHRVGDTSRQRPRDTVTRRNNAKWKNLSRRLRALQPWCSIAGCGNTDLEVDHIIPLKKGGDPYKISNLQILCSQHNAEKSDRLDKTQGDNPGGTATPPPVKAEFKSFTTGTRLRFDLLDEKPTTRRELHLAPVVGRNHEDAALADGVVLLPQNDLFAIGKSDSDSHGRSLP